MTIARSTKRLYSVPPLDAALQAAVDAKPGVCRYCGCTETTACRVQTLSGEEGCHWVDKIETICSASECTYRHGKFVGALMLELGDAHCCCGRRKKERNTFCGICYHRLPEEMHEPLYRHFGNGYEYAYARARQFLFKARPS